ncbi:LysR family transcriptional regulator [Rhodococcus rhodnii]|uniref:LysR family transcriptional regulator n=2 Tax=Rhodococcus rhodnii TaxID=38312 RepID=R7WN52_9NOCA|nr:LysR family transcriptional regulator [Rhodococcus rhodnii]EOM76720.1 LysR family transcriptional regulator [Rhodococcus rhodnii LMG 5362]TXG90086.1 LysR family transcriptional regulator [Rhodococcus rhodnii]
MEFSLHRLKLLRELRRRGTVTAAAASLNYTVSAVSQQLAQLERESGTRLFERQGRRMLLTEAGSVLADHAEEILASVERAGVAMEAARSGVSARLTAGVWASVAAGLLPAALARLAEEHPGIEVRTKELAPEETAGAVRDGMLDFSFVIDYSNHVMRSDPLLERELVARERMYVALASGGGDADSLTLDRLAERPWILSGPRSHFGKAVRRACQESGFEPRIVHEVGEQATALAMVAAGLGVTLVSDLGLSLLPDRIDIVPLADPFHRTVSVAHRATATPRESVRLVIDTVREAAAELGL